MMRLVALLAGLVAAVAPATADAGTVKISHSRYGDILVDGKGRTLYLFTKERTSKPRCYGDCARAWPPFFAKGAPQAGKGTDPRQLGTTKRRNGRRQMTYGGHPLYYYVADRKAGQITCQDVTEFGGTWLLVSKPGDAAR